jgi:prevent-host-death family protein
MQVWQIQEAKAKLSELLKRAESEGPQDITSHGKSVAVVVSRAFFDRMSGNSQSLVEFIQGSPLFGEEEIVFERSNSLTREVDL